MSSRFSQETQKNSMHGFRSYFGWSSDDLDHHNQSMHALSCKEIRNGQPSFRHLSCTLAPGKDSGGNAQKNLQVLSSEFEDEVLAHAIDDTTDNAASTTKESCVLFEKIQKCLLLSNDPAVKVLLV